MKFNYYNYIMIAGALLMSSCSKELEVATPPDFDVTTTAATYQAGKPITFNITGGEAHNVSFYSGETFKDYAFKDGRAIDVKGDGVTMDFRSSVQVGTQVNQLSILASTDFNGDYSSLAKVKAATWTDITSRFALGTTAAVVASGVKDITDLMVAGKPIYIAFKYVTKPQATNGLARQWFIQTFAVKSTATITNTATGLPVVLNIADQANAGFRIIDENAATKPGPNFVPYDKAPAQSVVTSTQVTLWGNRYLTPNLAIFNAADPMFDPKDPRYDPQSPAYVPTAIRPIYIPYDAASPFNDPLSEHWVVSKAINKDKVDLGPDRPVAAKTSITSAKLTSYNYTYARPGTYKAVFVASNGSADGTEQVTKEITITITP